MNEAIVSDDYLQGAIKELRRGIDACIKETRHRHRQAQNRPGNQPGSRELALTITKL